MLADRLLNNEEILLTLNYYSVYRNHKLLLPADTGAW